MSRPKPSEKTGSRGAASPAGRRPLGRLILILVLAAYAAWIVIRLASFKRYAMPPEIVRAEILPPGAAGITPREGPPPPVELRGAYHMHTRFSDGAKTVPEVAAAAARAGLDFVILTDHGAPNLASLEAQGKIGRVVVIAGTEISSSRGHLVALGFDRPEPPFSQNADLAVREIRSRGGISVVAHPYSKTRWSWGGPLEFDGIEVLNFDSDVRRGWVKSLLDFPVLLAKPEAALLKILDPPVESTRKWDQLMESAGRPLWGFYAVDAHRFFYARALAALNLHVQVDSLVPVDFPGAAAAVIEALRRGCFYSAVDGAADPAGFRFWREGEGSGATLLHVETPYSFAHETRLLLKGRTVASATGTNLVYEAREPGAYRVEVFLRERTPLGRDVPWICGNPIMVEKDFP
jgi:hypothetical protein